MVEVTKQQVTTGRETAEEIGIQVEITGLVGIFTDPRHVILYASNGKARRECSVVFTARPVGGEPTPSDESREVHWVDPDALGSLRMDRSMQAVDERELGGQVFGETTVSGLDERARVVRDQPAQPLVGVHDLVRPAVVIPPGRSVLLGGDAIHPGKQQ